jgi:arsenate reductase
VPRLAWPGDFLALSLYILSRLHRHGGELLCGDVTKLFVTIRHFPEKRRAMKRRVLFICNRNAGRSQMAEGILRRLYGDRYEVYSAGLHPADRLNPHTIAVMEELGIPMAHHRPKPVLEFVDMSFDVVVTMCECRDDCVPLPRTVELIHRTFSDPYAFRGSDEEIRSGFRAVRDEIREWVESFFL